MDNTPTWAIHYRNAMERSGGRCQLCNACQGSTGYYYGNQGNFRALSKSDRPVALQTLRDVTMEECDLVKINLSVHHYDGNLDIFDRENLMVLCQRCKETATSYAKGRRSHDIS